MTSLEQHMVDLPKLRSTDGKTGDLPAVYAFTPDAQATWVIWEYDPAEKVGFGLCDLGLGFPELGYVSISELESLRGPLNLPVEVDTAIETRFAGYANAGVPIPSFLQ